MTMVAGGWIGESFRRFAEDPVRTWQNDDLLLNDQDRREFRQRDPEVFSVLDWPEFRNAFKNYDKSANSAKKWTDGLRVAAVLAATSALVFAAIASMFPEHLRILAGVLALVLTFLSVALLAIGNMSLFGLDTAWLRNRFRTERLRQFFFQLILAEFDAASAAIGDPVALAEWRKRRQAILDNYVREVLSDYTALAAKMKKLVDDQTNEQSWINPLWAEASPLLNTDNDTRLLNALFTRRIQRQGKYILRKTAPNAHNAKSRSKILRIASGLVSYAMLLCAAVLGLLLAQGHGFDDATIRLLLALEALGGALLVGFRLASDAFGLAAESARYGRYEAEIEYHESKFLRSKLARDRYDALKDMELSSYREMREFIELHAGIRPTLG